MASEPNRPCLECIEAGRAADECAAFAAEERALDLHADCREREQKLREYVDCKDSCASNTYTQCDGSIRIGYRHSASSHDFQSRACDCGLVELLAAKETE